MNIVDRFICRERKVTPMSFRFLRIRTDLSRECDYRLP